VTLDGPRSPSPPSEINRNKFVSCNEPELATPAAALVETQYVQKLGRKLTQTDYIIV